MQQKDNKGLEALADIADIGDAIFSFRSDSAPRLTNAEAIAHNRELIKTPIRRLSKTKRSTVRALQNTVSIRDILKHDTWLVDEAFGQHSKWVRSFFRDNNIREKEWNYLLEKFLNNKGFNPQQDPRVRNTRRGNINRQVALSNMSVSVQERVLAICQVADYVYEGKYRFIGENPSAPMRSTSVSFPNFQQYAMENEQLEFTFGETNDGDNSG